MRKLVAAICAIACFALVLAGCASGGAASSSSAQPTSSTASGSTSASSTGTASSSSSVGMANPWSDVSSAEEAAKGAGFESFNTPVDLEISLGPIKEEWAKYRCMEGIAEVNCPAGAVEMFVRKGTTALASDGDISGDYNQYTHTWGQDINGLEVVSFGNRQGEATKTIWTNGDYCYCILAYGAGGDDDYGLPAEDLAVLVPAIS